MYTITLYQDNTYPQQQLAQYQSGILPMVGDIFASGEFEDNMQRIVTKRQLIPNTEYNNRLIIIVDYSFPQLVKLKQND